MNNKIIYIELQQAIELHNWIIEQAGGYYEQCDRLENILKEIKNNSNYPEFKHKLTHLIYAINKSDKSINKNQWLSIALGDYFLELNGYNHVVHYFTKKMENIV